MPYVEQNKRPVLDTFVARIADMFKRYGHQNWTRILYLFCQSLSPSYNTYKNYFGEVTEAAAEIRRRYDLVNLCQTEELLDVEVSDKERNEIRELVGHLKITLNVDGDLNYLLFAYQKRHLKKDDAKTSFVSTLEVVISVLRDEFLAPYEDIKIKENGDVK